MKSSALRFDYRALTRSEQSLLLRRRLAHKFTLRAGLIRSLNPSEGSSLPVPTAREFASARMPGDRTRRRKGANPPMASSSISSAHGHAAPGRSPRPADVPAAAPGVRAKSTQKVRGIGRVGPDLMSETGHRIIAGLPDCWTVTPDRVPGHPGAHNPCPFRPRAQRRYLILLVFLPIVLPVRL